MIDAVQSLTMLGGSATLAQMRDLSGQAALRRAVRRGEVIRLARGRYGLPDAPDPRAAAVRLQGVVSHESAARQWGLDLPSWDRRPHVTVPAHRGRVDRRGVELHWAALGSSDVVGGTTSPLRTVLDLARDRPLPTGLAAADHALRQRLVGVEDLRSAAAALRGHGCRQARLVARHADPRAESPLESALRAGVITSGVRGFVPQLWIEDGPFRVRVDLGDRRRRLVLEADSFAYHGHRAALADDCRRYTELAIRGWRVLRFAWEHVMFEPDWVAACVRNAVR